jgi:WD40 repeat protein
MSRYLASGGDDMQVHIWDARTGQTMLIYRGHATSLWNFVESLAWSPDGTRIASGNDDWQVHVWTAPLLS